MVTEQCVKQIPIVTCHLVKETKCCQIPVTTCHLVKEQCVKQVPYTVCEMVCEQRVKCVPVTTCEMQAVQCVRKECYTVCKQVECTSTICCPEKIHKQVPVCHSVCVPKTICKQVPVHDLRESPGVGGKPGVPLVAMRGESAGVLPRDHLAGLHHRHLRSSIHRPVLNATSPHTPPTAQRPRIDLRGRFRVGGPATFRKNQVV